MNVLLINGSPKGEKSNSLQLAQAFVRGIGEEKKVQLDTVTLSSLQVGACKGCFCCWNKTPGQCVIRDDMEQLLQKMLNADVIVYSFPLYYFSVPGILKNFIDRQLPMVLPFMADREDGVGSGSHEARYDLSRKKYVLVSTCGFYSARGNYDSVLSMFDHICGKNNYEAIFCGQGELFRVKEVRSRTGEYLAHVQQAGKEWAKGGITAPVRQALDTLLYPKDVFEKMADASWGVSKEDGQKEDESLSFTRQMAALYNPDSFDGKRRVLEMHYTDLDKTYQLFLEKDQCRVVTEGFEAADTRIHTPFTVWQQIARGEIRGDAALARQMYRVEGDFALMIGWDRYFGSGTPAAPAEEKTRGKRKPLLLTFLLPFTALWMAWGISPEKGPWITLFLCAAMPLWSLIRQFTRYDVMAVSCVSLLSALALALGNTVPFQVMSYLAFGLMWLLSVFTKEPLCAAYVKYNYGGEDALQNPLFMNTNRILAALWGILYVVLAGLNGIFGPESMAVVNYAAPAAAGIFTGWFEKWHPAHVAAGKK